MARPSTTPLDRGDPFPQMAMQLANGANLSIPDQFAGAWAVVLLYRGHW